MRCIVFDYSRNSIVNNIFFEVRCRSPDVDETKRFQVLLLFYFVSSLALSHGPKAGNNIRCSGPEADYLDLNRRIADTQCYLYRSNVRVDPIANVFHFCTLPSLCEIKTALAEKYYICQLATKARDVVEGLLGGFREALAWEARAFDLILICVTLTYLLANRCMWG